MTTKEKKNTHRKTAIIVGVLFIIATVGFFIGQAIYDPILSASDYLDTAYPEKTIVIVGLLIELTSVLAIPLIPVFLFPILKKQNEALALGYVVFRILEAMLLILALVGSLSLINLGQDYLESGGVDASYFQNLGSSIQSVGDWAFSISIVVFALGALMLYYLLYRSRLVPRSISAWGLIAAIWLLTGTVLILIDMFTGISELGLELVFFIPIAVNEMVLAIWLIVKGFNPSAIASESA